MRWQITKAVNQFNSSVFPRNENTTKRRQKEEERAIYSRGSDSLSTTVFKVITFLSSVVVTVFLLLLSLMSLFRRMRSVTNISIHTNSTIVKPATAKLQGKQCSARHGINPFFANSEKYPY